ncbi:MAG: phosphate/phosphite/phosphonate ABC transporter substrate-binding protein [Nitrospirae bacterium]|nr:MAG: phosphate/phosphite/phosphonate ABC transporter substrate-binding protein [Nitrospirota bacterium]
MSFKKSLEFKVLSVVGTILVAGVIIASVMSVSIQKETLYRVTEFSTEKTADVIFQNIETTMIDGKADITKKIVDKLSRIRGIEEITVLNDEGREAFKQDAPARETAAMAELKSGKERLVTREGVRLTMYMPLKNTESCFSCHGQEKKVLGAVKVAVTIEKEYRKAMSLIALVIAITIIASLGFSLLLWIMLRKMVISPVKSIAAAAATIAEGDLSFNVTAQGDDEIGRLSSDLKESFSALETVLQRIKELSARIMTVVEEVEQEAVRVMKGAEAEAEATSNISSSVAELTVTTTEIAFNTDDLAASAGNASASIDEMVSSIRHINESIQELDGIVDSTSASIGQLSSTIKEVADSSAELSVASDETLAAISEIAAAIREVEASAKDSAALSEQVASDASTLGMASIAKTVEGMKEIESSVQNTAQCISALGNRSKEIEKILGVIQSVNDETGLLSLNAAILASKAGEHGRGFAIVASEMKDLSQRTETSTGDIAALIRAVQNEVVNAERAMNKGVRAVETGLVLTQEAYEALSNVLGSSRKASEMTLSIKRSTTEQAKAAGQVMEATERVKKMIETIAGATRDQAKGIEVISAAAERMKKLSFEVSKATAEQATSSGQIAEATETVSEKSRQISRSLSEQKTGADSILTSIEEVKDIPVANKNLASRISATIWNLQKDAVLLKAELERFRFSEKGSQSLRLGVVPLQDPSVMFRKFSPLAKYLSGKIGKKVDLRVAIDMESAEKDLGENTTQFCAMGPANYVNANLKYGVRVVARALRKGKPFHRAAIVAKEDSGLQTLKDLKGKTFAFMKKGSATGHIMPLASLKEAGIGMGDLSRHAFLGANEKIISAILSGQFDAGALTEEAAVDCAGKGLTVLRFSAEIPEFNICCNSSLDAGTVDAIRDALLSLDLSRKEDSEVLLSLGRDCTGFVRAAESDYVDFRRILMSIDAEHGS